MKKKILSTLLATSLISGAGSLFAAVPETISYQGYLTDSADVAVQGTQSVTFKLYNASGTEIWSETQQLTVVNGVFKAVLGSLQALPSALQDGASLGVTLGTNAEMTPRQQLDSAPFALHAKTTEQDTLNTLSCTVDQIAKWNGTQWGCADDEFGQNANITATDISAGEVVKGITVLGATLKDNVTLTAGNRISLTTSGSSIVINAEESAGTSVIAGSGLTLTGSTLAIGAGAVQASMIAGSQVVKGLVVGASQLKDNVTLVGGAGVTLVPTANTVTINASMPSNIVTTDGNQVISGPKTFSSSVNFKNDIILYNDGGDAIDFRKANGSSIGEIGFGITDDGVSNWYFDLNGAANRILFDDDVYIGHPRTSGGTWRSGKLTVVREINAYDHLKLYKKNGGSNSESVTFTGEIFGNGNGIAIWPDNPEDYGVDIRGLRAASNHNDEYMRLGNYITFSEGDTAGGDLDIYLGSNSNKLLKIRGNLEVIGTTKNTSGGTWASLSDQRLKKNIQAMSSATALEKLTSLAPVKYEWIHPEEHGNKDQEYGFIAQELESVFPGWVSETLPQGEDVNLVPEKAKAIHFPHEFNAYVVSALQELKTQNELLKAIVCEDHPEKELCQKF